MHADAYDKTLGLIHTWVVRAGIKTGMLGLPSTDSFLQSIGETREQPNPFLISFTGMLGLPLAGCPFMSSIFILWVGGGTYCRLSRS